MCGTYDQGCSSNYYITDLLFTSATCVVCHIEVDTQFIDHKAGMQEFCVAEKKHRIMELTFQHEINNSKFHTGL